MKADYSISLVSYWNTLPFVYGLESTGLDKQLKISHDLPSLCAKKLLSGQVDIGLVPVAVIPELDYAQVISDYCIGTRGAVKTVCIFSEKPLEQLERIYLDYQSRTSVRLAEILLREYWNWDGELIPAEPGYEQKLKGFTGGLIIGDRAIEAIPKFRNIYDLGKAWKTWTGRPFVFAAWVANKPVPQSLVTNLNEAFEAGIEAIPELVKKVDFPYKHFDLYEYYTKYISYELDHKKHSAMEIFLSRLKEGHADPV